MNLIVNIAGILVGFALGYILSYLHTKQDQEVLEQDQKMLVECVESNQVVIKLQKELIELYEKQITNYEGLVQELGAINE